MTTHDSVKHADLSPVFGGVARQVQDKIPLVLLHGWGMNRCIWEPLLPGLGQRFAVTAPDLPGHGQRQAEPLGTLEQAVASLLPLIPAGAVVLGWSMGGILAQQLAWQHPERVRALILVGSTPRFMNGDGWEYGLALQVLDGFAANLQLDQTAALKRFFALQFMGLKTGLRELNALRDRVLARPASPQALVDGLDILRHSDLRRYRPRQPALWLLGQLDRLIPVALAQGLLALDVPPARIQVMAHAAHVPFVTHTEAFLQQVLTFLDQQDL
ncbi:MAG: alpha/beta fold hydrolase [Thiothrix sp.]|nr:alpha/beta fold hydrolase [Thiothrix sp.]HPQ96291.1 alpha/beta fold hydrolase [Thiolinea sp.]